MTDLDIRENEPLARYTSWRIGGPARFFTNVSNADQLQQAIAWAKNRELPLFVLGGGTNLLALDEGWHGLVLRYRDLATRLEEEGETARLLAGAGAPMAGTARRVSHAGWDGLAWAEGVPGTIGGAVFGNAGCYGGEIASQLTHAWLLVDGSVEEWPVERLGYGYRTSLLKHSELPAPRSVRPIVLAAAFLLPRGDQHELRERIKRIANERKGKTPVGSSCGSVFKNPPGQSAGRLIEQAGLKGARSGGAVISERHANYIVNEGGATSDDILRLIERATTEVLLQFGINLELEVQILSNVRF